MSSILKGLQLNELSNEKLGQYKKAAGADAKKADSDGDYKRGDKRFSGIVKATKKQFANDEKQLKEFAPVGGDDREPDEEEILRQLAAQWFNGDEDPRAEKTLAAMGWEIGYDESGDDDAGVFLIRSGDINGDTYIAFNQSDLELNEAFNNYHANRTGFTRPKRDLSGEGEPQGMFMVMIDGRPWKEFTSNVAFARAKTLADKNPTKKIQVRWPTGQLNTVAEDELDENCWKGYHKEGNKELFGKTVPNCVKNEDVAEGWQEESQDLEDWSKEVNKRLYRVHESQRPALARQLSKVEQKNFGSTLNQGGLTELVHSALMALQKGQMVHYDPQSVGSMPFGNIVGDDARIIAAAGINAYDAKGYHALKRAGIVDNIQQFLRLKDIADTKGQELLKYANMDPVEGWMQFVKDIGWSKDDMNEEVQAKTDDKLLAYYAQRKAEKEKQKQQGVAEGMPADNDMGTTPSGAKMTLGQWKQMWMKKMPNADFATLLRSPPNMQGSAIAYFDGWMNNPDARWDPQRSMAEEQHSCPHCGGEMVSEELMNEKKDACYYKVKSRYKVWPSAYASGALVKCRKKGADSWGNGGKKNESSILEGIGQVDENLHQWFKEKWVRFGPDGKIRGDCARGDDSEGKPKCLPQSKAHSLGKKGRASAASRKRREDPNPERSGKAINVNTKKKSNESVAEGSNNIEVGDKITWWYNKFHPNYEGIVRRVSGNTIDVYAPGSGSMYRLTKQDIRSHEKKGVAEAGDTAKGQKMLAKVHNRAADRVTSKQADKDPAYARKAQQTQDRAWERLAVKEETLDEKWSQKYKDSINCSNPKGFSQRAHCQGKNK